MTAFDCSRIESNMTLTTDQTIMQSCSYENREGSSDLRLATCDFRNDRWTRSYNNAVITIAHIQLVKSLRQVSDGVRELQDGEYKHLEWNIKSTRYKTTLVPPFNRYRPDFSENYERTPKDVCGEVKQNCNSSYFQCECLQLLNNQINHKLFSICFLIQF